MVTAVTALNKQIKSLAPELNSATLPDLVDGDELERRGSDRHDGQGQRARRSTSSRRFPRAGTTMGSCTVHGMTGQRQSRPWSARTAPSPSTAGKFSDAFAANGVHIYQIDLAAVTCN